jgi:hypothetical protein
MDGRAKRLVTAYVAATALSGAPSTAVALVRGGVLDAPRAAGTLWPGRRDRPGLLAGAAAHVAVSAWWVAVLEPPLRRLRPVPAAVAGAVAGAGIAALDLDVIAHRRYPAIRALPQGPQWVDHLAFGAIVGWAVGRR